MNNKPSISETVLSAMKQFLYNELLLDQTAGPSDMLFITEGAWLKDAAVIDAIVSRQGGWDVSLIFAHYKKPLQLIVRNITRQFSEQKARVAAFYIRKEAAKDRRGTLALSLNYFSICNN